jgi:protein TonB
VKRKRRQRRAPRAYTAVRQTIAVPDPLLRSSGGVTKRSAIFVAVIVAAIVVHGGALVFFFGANFVMRAFAAPAPAIDSTPIEVAMIEPPPPPPPEPEPKKEEPPPEPKKPIEKVKPKQAPPPPPDPIDKKEEPPPDPKKDPPRRIVGLSLESMATGSGGGASFASGNTRMGTTAHRAEDASQVAPLPKTIEPIPPPAANRAATQIPTGAKWVKPERKRKVDPAYPEKFRQQGIEADVVVRVSIDRTGHVTNVEIVSHAQYPEFDEAATTAARQEEFTPATKEGEPIAYALTYTYRFRLND